MDTSILDRAQQWSKESYFDENDRNEIIELLESKNETEIINRFYRDLEFGTGGLRSILGMGSNRINKYNIRRATQAVANQVLSSSGANKVVISYDSRKFSFEFAKESAGVFAANGIDVLIYDQLNPVPLLSFAIRHYQAQAGVMITASHNPPEYNGFKVFWSNGAQVTPPEDKQIISHYNELTDWQNIKSITFEEGISNKSIKWLGKETEDLYHSMLLEHSYLPQQCKEHGASLSIVFTPLHGTGKVPCCTALENLGFSNIHLVMEQAEPDSAFPTVSSPNPEDVEAMAMAEKQMLSLKADLAFGTDPDTDRLGVVVNHKGSPVYLNGNQIGVILLDYIIEQLKKQGKNLDDYYAVKTIVTSELQTIICQSNQLKIHDTLTGFKWIGALITKLESENKQFVFASEESYGYLNHTYARDKDGVGAMALTSEVALHHKLQGKNLVEALDGIYEKYAFSLEELLSKKFEGKAGQEKISAIMDHFRALDLKEIAGLTISNKIDLNDSDRDTLVELPNSNVFGYGFECGSKLFLRPSGTEPKIKFYLMINIKTGDLQTKKVRAKEIIASMIQFIDKEVEKA